LFELAAQDEVQSRLVIQDGVSWRLKHGPFQRRALPPLKRPSWTLLVQGVDLHQELAHALVQAFRFVPDCRLDDLMISYATDGGGVGPHFDSYDVFLLQVQGSRRWRIGRQKDLSLQAGVPLKILADFAPEQEFLLEAGDMLYLPPRYAHDGVAVGGDCMTYSIGFRSAQRDELAREMLQRLADDALARVGEARYPDPKQGAVATPGAIPEALTDFARQALAAALKDDKALPRLMGEYLTEPKSQVWFETCDKFRLTDGVLLDRRTRMMYDPHHVFINGESYRASGADARLMRRLADARSLDALALSKASAQAKDLLMAWGTDGWLQEG
jgi:50S ribosomal protein L16 3-hydroxylase